ncbi:hypothetical protein FQN54_003552 [Arachnomyces sp. PD_36]|nr:hypothetical protein FQN54_003552 [Arachnomyces sp. PD_36]
MPKRSTPEDESGPRKRLLVSEPINEEKIKQEFIDHLELLHLPDKKTITNPEGMGLIEKLDRILEENKTIMEENKTIMEENKTIMEENKTIKEELEFINKRLYIFHTIRAQVLDVWADFRPANFEQQRHRRNAAVHGGNIIEDCLSIQEMETRHPERANAWKSAFFSFYRISFQRCQREMKGWEDEVVEVYNAMADATELGERGSREKWQKVVDDCQAFLRERRFSPGTFLEDGSESMDCLKRIREKVC